MRALQTGRGELPIGVEGDPGLGEERVVGSEEMGFAQLADPVARDGLDLFADGEEPGREGLAVLRAHLAGILIEMALVEIDMAQLERGDGVVAGAGQEDEGDKRAVAALNRRSRRRLVDRVLDLL